MGHVPPVKLVHLDRVPSKSVRFGPWKRQSQMGKQARIFRVLQYAAKFSYLLYAAYIPRIY